MPQSAFGSPPKLSPLLPVKIHRPVPIYPRAPLLLETPAASPAADEWHGADAGDGAADEADARGPAVSVPARGATVRPLLSLTTSERAALQACAADSSD